MFGFTPLRRTYSAALRDLGSPRSDVRASAAQDLGLVGDTSPREAADALVALLDDPVAPVRSAALTAMATLGARHLVDLVAARIDDPDSTVRQVAAMAVAELGGETALGHLRKAICHALPEVRFQALLGLIDGAPLEGLAAAQAALGSEDVWIASEAALQLGGLVALTSPTARITPREPPLDLDPRTRASAVEALATHLDSAHDRVVVSAALALARAGDARAVPVLSHFVLGRRQVEGEDAGELLAEAIAALGTAPAEVRGEARAALDALATRMLPTVRRRLARDALAALDARTTDTNPRSTG